MIALFLTTESFLRGLYSFIQAPMTSISRVLVPHSASCPLSFSLPHSALSPRNSVLSTLCAMRYALAVGLVRPAACVVALRYARFASFNVGTGKIKSNLKTKEPKADLTPFLAYNWTEGLLSSISTSPPKIKL